MAAVLAVTTIPLVVVPAHELEELLVQLDAVDAPVTNESPGLASKYIYGNKRTR